MDRGEPSLGALPGGVGCGRHRDPLPTVLPRASTRSRRKQVVPTRLVVVEPAARAGTEYPLGPDMTVGRAQGCNLVFDEQYVSQVHTRLLSREGSVFVEDLGSTNGTWVNGTRAVGQMPARLGDRIQIGNVVMEVR